MRSNLTWEELERRRKGKRVLVAVAVGLGMLYAVSSLFADTAVVRHYNMLQTHHELSDDLAKTQLWNEVLEAEIDKVKNDPMQLEGLARISLGMVREGETVYRFVDVP
jgi:cell division protein FtsB